MKLSRLTKILLIFVLLFSFFISIGYSALNASLSVSGDLVYRVPADIRITGVKISSVTNGGVEQYSPKYTKDTVSVGLKLPNLNSTVVYEVTIKNSSSKKKMISSITDKVVGNSNISYTSNYQLKTPIEAGSTLKILFTYKYNSGVTAVPSDQIKENTIFFTFEDATLYEALKLDANSNNHAKVYTGDTSTFKGKEKIYYYYGEVTNNNVLFAGFCWKIVRTTDTGGVKLLYNGEPDSSGKCPTGRTDNIGTSPFNSNYQTIADVGYMYNQRYNHRGIQIDLSSILPTNLTTTINDTKKVVTLKSKSLDAPVKIQTLNTNTNSDNLVFSGEEPRIHRLISTDPTNKIFGNSVTYNTTTKQYTLSGTTKTISDWMTDYTELKNTHYTCWNTGATCSRVSYVFNAEDNVAHYMELENGDKIEDILERMLSAADVNTINSTIKTFIDDWYSKNMTEFTSYLEDTVWCNSRRIASLGSFNPDGGTINQFLSYWSSSNLSNLTCPDKLDSFTTNTQNGNGKLKYPVGLITQQERNLSYDSNISPLFSENKYWTLSPDFFYVFMGGPTIYCYGDHINNNEVPKGEYAVRPSVSLRSGIEYLKGDGTTDNPYVILSCDSTTPTYGEWSEWGTCSKTCGGGTQTRTRTVTNKSSYDGSICSTTTESESRSCNTQDCCSSTTPTYGEWSDYGTCSKTCGGGTKTRTRTVTNKSSYDGSICSTNTQTDSQDCNTQTCCSSTTPTYGAWSGWGECSKKCGGGTQTRTRTVTNKSSYDGSICSTNTQTESQDCNTQTCCSSTTPTYGEWSGWGECSKKCDSGTQTRTRTVTNISNYDGSTCPATTETASQSCNTQGCCSSTTPTYGAWSGWGDCSKTCGGGTQTRTRTVTNKSSYDGRICSNTTQSTSQACNTQLCAPEINCRRDNLLAIFTTYKGGGGHWHYCEVVGFGSTYYPTDSKYGDIIQQSYFQWYHQRYGSWLSIKGQSVSSEGLASNMCTVP